LVVVVAIACTSGPGGSSGDPPGERSVVPIVVSPVLAVGPNRFIYSLLDGATNEPLARPDRSSTVRFVAPDGGAALEAPATFIWAIDDLRGLYVSRATFDRPGRWTAQITVSSGAATWPSARAEFVVAASRPGIAVGSAAPRLDNPTLATVDNDIRRLTTDIRPDLRFYQRSVAQLLDAHQPFVLVFASPGFCTSGTCGPTLERVKAAAQTYPTLSFVQIESYAEHLESGRLQPDLDASGNLVPSSALETYGVPSETSVLVVDRAGLIHDIFDVLVGTGELETVLSGLES
jgi:hypothetical protein